LAIGERDSLACLFNQDAHDTHAAAFTARMAHARPKLAVRVGDEAGGFNCVAGTPLPERSVR